MPAPYDYTIQAADPFGAFARGQAQAEANRQMQEQRAAQEAAKQRQMQMQSDLAAASRDIRLMPQFMANYPEIAKSMEPALKAMTEEQSRSALDHGGQVLSALNTGRGDIAAALLRDRATAYRNSGDERRAQLHDALAQTAEKAPDVLKSATAAQLSLIPGGDKLIEGMTRLAADQRAAELQPAAVEEGKAKAVTAQVKAKYADSEALLDLQKKGWDIEGIKADIDHKKQSTRIAAMNAAIAREGNDLKRQELRLKVQEAQSALDEKARARVADVEAAAFSMDNMLNTIERIKGNKSLNDVVGSLEGALPAMVTSGMDDEESDAIALIDTLGSQAFLSQIPNVKGMGQLSNAEGEKLQAALQNLKRNQSEAQFRRNLDEAARLVKKARDTVQKRYGVQAGKPDTPATPGSRPPLSSFGG